MVSWISHVENRYQKCFSRWLEGFFSYLIDWKMSVDAWKSLWFYHKDGLFSTCSMRLFRWLVTCKVFLVGPPLVKYFWQSLHMNLLWSFLRDVNFSHEENFFFLFLWFIFCYPFCVLLWVYFEQESVWACLAHVRTRTCPKLLSQPNFKGFWKMTITFVQSNLSCLWLQ